jgi:hypothetical protein
MTLRMHAVYVAMAALVLMIADVAASYAAMRLCNAQPERCRYSADGRQYFYPSGRPMPTGIGQATNAGGWGCGATDGTATGRSWGYPNKAGASYRALAACMKRSAQGGCHVVSCSASVHNYAEAQVAWFADR